MSGKIANFILSSIRKRIGKTVIVDLILSSIRKKQIQDMADNYLERRMEDLRSGRLQASAKAAPAKSQTAAKRMAGLRVVVTGGANGIGAEIVKQFRDQGATVDILDTDRTHGTRVAQATGACFRPVDISDTEAFVHTLRSILEKRGDIDVIINNAATVDFRPLTSNSAELLMRSMAVNVAPILEGARILALHREERGVADNPYGGRIINIASTRASMSEAGTECYSASKGAVVSLTHALMMSLAPYRITVNSISPGWIHTGAVAELTESDHSQHPSGRVGTPADIASLCLYIASPASAFLNGENITVDGGHTHRMHYL